MQISSAPSSGGSRLTLNDPYWDRVNVEIVITKSSDCDNRTEGYISSRDLAIDAGRLAVLCGERRVHPWMFFGRLDDGPSDDVRERRLRLPGQSQVVVHDASILLDAVKHVEQAVLKAGIALGAAALTREQAQSNLRRGHRILVYGFDVLMLKQHVRQAADAVGSAGCG